MSDIPSSVKDKVISKLNAEFGNDVKNLFKCSDLAKTLLNEKEKIENEILKASKSVSSEEAISEIKNTFQSVDEITEEFNRVCGLVKEKESSMDETLMNHQQKINQIEQLEQVLCYLTFVQSIQNLSSNMEMLLISRSDTEVVEEFCKLCQMCSALHTSKCSHLKTFLSNTVHYWHNVLKDKFSVQLDELLKCAGWPLVSSTVFTSPPPDAMAKFQLVVKHLLNIQRPPELSPAPAVTSSLLGPFPTLSLPITLMLKPLRKRFVYHFCGTRQTNRLDKPEWYMTQILTWIRDHENFLLHWVQPVFNQAHIQTSAKMQFTQGLVQVVVDKLHSELPTLLSDDTLFSHTVDETLAFHRELLDTVGCVEGEGHPSALTTLTQAHVFVKWIHMERKYARDKMDSILSSESAWAEVGGSEDLKVTEAAEAFLTLLSTMTERYSMLPQPGHRLQFVELQVELVDELRVRLLQLLHTERHEPLESQLPAILNTTSYIYTVLTEWGTSPHFLMLHHFKSQLMLIGGDTGLSAAEAAEMRQGTVFDEVLTLLQRLVSELVDAVCEAVMLEVKARSRQYRRDKWFAMMCEEGLTPSACPMFQVLVNKLQTLQTLLAAPLFTTAWQSIATHLCTFLLEELVLQNRFNEGGAKQFEQDLNRNLIPLFHQYTLRPEAYFLPLREACALLNVRPLPSEWTRGQFSKLPEKLEVNTLNAEMIRNVIQKRADIIPDLI